MDPTGLNNGPPKYDPVPEDVVGAKHTGLALAWAFITRKVGGITYRKDEAERIFETKLEAEYEPDEGSPVSWGSDECVLGLPKSRKETPKNKPPFSASPRDWGLDVHFKDRKRDGLYEPVRTIIITSS